MPEPDPTSDERRWQRSEDVVFRRLPEGIVLLAPEMHEPLALTGPASLLWDLLLDRPTRQALAAKLAEIHGESRQQIDADLADAWEELAAAGIIEISTRVVPR